MSSEQRADALHRRIALIALGGAVEGDGIERCRILIVSLSEVKVHENDPVVGDERVVYFHGLLAVHILHHDIRRAVGDELSVHYLETLLGFRAVRQIGLYIVLDLYPLHRERRKNYCRDEEDYEHPAQLYDKLRDAMHKGIPFHCHVVAPLLRLRETYLHELQKETYKL